MIRFAQMSDLAGINVLHEQLHIQHIGYRPDIFAPIEQPIFDSLMKEYLIDAKKRILISENDGKVDGYAALSISDTRKGEGEILPFVFIEVNELCVAENAQRKGIGSALLDGVKLFAKEQGAKFVELGVNAENKRAQEFYKANGMFVKNYKMQFRVE